MQAQTEFKPLLHVETGVASSSPDNSGEGVRATDESIMWVVDFIRSLESQLVDSK